MRVFWEQIRDKAVDAMGVLYEIHPLLLGVILPFIGCCALAGTIFGIIYLVELIFF